MKTTALQLLEDTPVEALEEVSALLLIDVPYFDGERDCVLRAGTQVKLCLADMLAQVGARYLELSHDQISLRS